MTEDLRYRLGGLILGDNSHFDLHSTHHGYLNSVPNNCLLIDYGEGGAPEVILLVPWFVAGMALKMH